MEKEKSRKICIETLGQVLFNPTIQKSERYPGRRIICDPSFRFASATGRPITAQELYENMSSIPNRREFLILSSSIQYPEEYRQIIDDTTSEKKIIAGVLSVQEISENTWELLDILR